MASAARHLLYSLAKIKESQTVVAGQFPSNRRSAQTAEQLFFDRAVLRPEVPDRTARDQPSKST